MASAWGLSWGSTWGSSWGANAVAPVVVVVRGRREDVEPPRPEYADLKKYDLRTGREIPVEVLRPAVPVAPEVDIPLSAAAPIRVTIPDPSEIARPRYPIETAAAPPATEGTPTAPENTRKRLAYLLLLAA